MAPRPVGTFEFPRKLAAKKRQALQRAGVTRLWREYLGDLARDCYPAELTEPKFAEAIYSCCDDAVPYKDDIYLYGCLFPEMVALQHANLQSDNAYYWRDEEGTMDCGIIDWGSASPGNFTQRLVSSITSAEGEVLDEHEDGLLRCFVDEYLAGCGIQLDFFEVRRQWWLSYITYMYSMGVNIEMEVFRETPREQWASIRSLWDPRVVGVWNVRCYAFMIGSALRYLHLRWRRAGSGRLHVHELFLEWKAFWEAKGMT